jgi:hypothetical protein
LAERARHGFAVGTRLGYEGECLAVVLAAGSKPERSTARGVGCGNPGEDSEGCGDVVGRQVVLLALDQLGDVEERTGLVEPDVRLRPVAGFGSALGRVISSSHFW